MRSRQFTLVAVSLGALAVACSTDRPTSPRDTDPVSAAAEFNRLGDSVMAAGGASADAAPFYGAAGVVGLAREITTVAINVDGEEVKLNAIAIAVEIPGGPMIMCPLSPTTTGRAAPYVCPWGIPHVTRTLFAWRPGRTSQIVTLSAMVDSGPVGIPVPVLFAGAAGTPRDSASSTDAATARPIPAHLEYWDGTGRLWWGIGGTQANSVKPTGKDCPAPPTSDADKPRAGILPRATCQLAEFTFAFDARAGAPPFFWRWNDADSDKRLHNLVLKGAALTGAYLKLNLMAAGPG